MCLLQKRFFLRLKTFFLDTRPTTFVQQVLQTVIQFTSFCGHLYVKKSKKWDLRFFMTCVARNLYFFTKSKLGKNRNVGQKLKFWSKIKILIKNWNFGQKLNFWSKIEILVKKSKSGQKSKFWSKIEILLKNRNFWSRSLPVGWGKN